MFCRAGVANARPCVQSGASLPARKVNLRIQQNGSVFYVTFCLFCQPGQRHRPADPVAVMVCRLS
jgi:hypothetical protein